MPPSEDIDSIAQVTSLGHAGLLTYDIFILYISRKEFHKFHFSL